MGPTMPDLRGATVLVTGAGGFIGSHLVERLIKEDARVRAFVRYNSRASIGALADVDESIRGEAELVFGDIRDTETIARAARGVSVIFHLAAQIAIPYSYFAPKDVFETNVLGTLNVLEAGRRASVNRIVHTSTSEVFGTAQYVPIDERHPMQGQSPYSASKIGADRVAESFFRSFGCPVVTVRPFNTFGPRQSLRAIIPTIILQLLDRRHVLKLGSLTPTRDFTYVEDTVAGFLAAGTAADVEGMEINLGTGSEVAVGDLVKLVAGAMEVTVPQVECESERLRPERSEVERLVADNRRARELLAWSPTVPFVDGIRRTVEWLRAHRDWYRSTQFQL